MDIFNIQTLISQNKVASLDQLDLDNTYIQVGIYQKGFSKRGAGNANVYPPAAVPLSEFINSGCGKPFPFKVGSVGPRVSFRKASGSDPYANRDVILPGKVELTRGNNGGGIYNIAVENSYNTNSPANTLWSTQYVDEDDTSWAPLFKIPGRNYATWRNASMTPAGNYAPSQYVGMPAVMSYKDGPIVRYWLIMFTEWGVGAYGEEGAFAYDRYEIYPPVNFTRADYADNVIDIISPGVHIVRDSNSGSIYNAVNEPFFAQGVSVRNTKWNSSYTDTRGNYSGFVDLSNLEERVYTDFYNAVDNLDSNVTNTDLIMWDMTTNLYYKVKFSSWTSSGNGGGFEYTRTVIPQSCGITYADLTVTNTKK